MTVFINIINGYMYCFEHKKTGWTFVSHGIDHRL
jgi:hypothetical protein